MILDNGGGEWYFVGSITLQIWHNINIFDLFYIKFSLVLFQKVLDSSKPKTTELNSVSALTKKKKKRMHKYSKCDRPLDSIVIFCDDDDTIMLCVWVPAHSLLLFIHMEYLFDTYNYGHPIKAIRKNIFLKHVLEFKENMNICL